MKKVYISEEQRNVLLFENEGGNMKRARKYLEAKGYNPQQRQEILDSIRRDIPNSRLQQCKFLLGVTRLYIEGELQDGESIMNLNKMLKYISSDAHVNEYDYNLNGENLDTLVSRFSTVSFSDLEADKAASNSRSYVINNDYNIIAINSFEESSKYGEYTSWCVTHDENMLNSYTNNGSGRFYFCLKRGFENLIPEEGENCPLDEYGLSMVAISVDMDGALNTCTCRWNHSKGGNDSIMTVQEIEQLIGRNFYQTFLPYSREELRAKGIIPFSDVQGMLDSGTELDYIFTNTFKASPDGILIVSLNNKENYLTPDKKILSQKWFDSCGIFGKENHAKVTIRRKYNVINRNGQLVSRNWYETINNLIVDEIWLVKNDGKYNLLTKNGDIISKDWFNDVNYRGFAYTHILTVVNESGFVNYMKDNGELISNEWFVSGNNFTSYGLALVENDKGEQNLLTIDGRLVFERWYDINGLYDAGSNDWDSEPELFVISVGNKENVIDKHGKIVSDVWFDYVDYRLIGGFVKVKLNGKYNAIDQDGRMISKEWFENVDFWYGKIYVRKNHNNYNVVYAGNGQYELVSNDAKYLHEIRKNKTILISERQKKHLKKAIAAQDQVGGKVNAGIMDAVAGGTMCEEELIESPDRLKDFDSRIGSWGSQDAIAFMGLEDNPDKIYVSDFYGDRHCDFLERLVKKGILQKEDIPDFSMWGRYWEKLGIISFWDETPSKEVILDVVKAIYDAGYSIDKNTLILEDWFGAGFTSYIPLKWLFNGTYDIFKSLGLRRSTIEGEGENEYFRVELNDDRVFNVNFNGDIMKPSYDYGNVDESKKINETSDVFNVESYKRSKSITFVTLANSPKVYSTDEIGITHERFLQNLMRDGVIEYFYIESSRLSPSINRYKTGRYWIDSDTISFWETPAKPGLRGYLRDTVEQLGLNKETLDVDFWDTRREIKVMSPFVLPYKWIVNGTLDDLLKSGAYSITKTKYGLYHVIIDFKHYFMDRNGDIVGDIVNNNLQESKKKKIVNDKGETVPEKCDKCGGEVVLQIHGEPVYVCKDCGKYFGTMPFNLKEGMVYQHGSTPHKEISDFKPNVQPLIMYKQFKLRLDKNGNNLAPGYVFPLYVNTEADGVNGKQSKGLEIGKWYKSGEGECWLDTKNNRLYTKGKGYGTDGNTLQKLAYRPGWHLTTTPWGNQRGDNKVIGGKPGTGNNYINTRNNEVWAKVEICVDIDATERARAMSSVPIDQCLQSLGDREYYKYKTNSNASDDQAWYIVDMIRIVDILDDDTVDSTNNAYYNNLLANNPGKKLNSDPYSYTKDMVNDIPYWKMPRTNGKRYSRADIEAMGYKPAEPTKINENISNRVEEMYRGYDGSIGTDRGYENLLWLTDDLEYAKSYAEEVPKRNPGHVGVVKKYMIDFSKCEGSVYSLPEDVDYYDGPDEELQEELLEQGINSYGFYANQDSSYCLCLWGDIPQVGEPEIVFRTDEMQENVDAQKYQIGFEKGGFEPYGHVLNESHEWCDSFEYTPYLKSISNFLQDNGINVKPFPRVKLHREEQEGLYVKTGYYDPDERKVHLFIADRHPKDVLRSFTHEMIHHSQNLKGMLKGYKGETLDGDGVLQKLESEAYLKGNIYFRKWTEELRPEIPSDTVKKKTRLNESIQDIYNMQDDWDMYGVSSILSEFFSDKRNGVTKKHWDLIPAQQYQNLLTRYMENPATSRIPDNIVYDWFKKTVRNAFNVLYITELAGHAEGPFPTDEVQDEFDAWLGPGKYVINDYYSGCDALDDVGFFEWSTLPDGSDGWSDFGIGPIFNELANYQPNMSAGDLLVLINRVLHIGHWRGDLTSAFIEGGSETCSNISGIIRENVEPSQNLLSWFGKSVVVDENGNPKPMYHGTNAEFTAFSKDFFTHGGTAYLGIGFNFVSSDITASGYGKNVHEVYLKAEHPMTNTKKTLKFNDLVQAINAIDADEDPDGSICTNILGMRIEKPTYRDVFNAAKSIYDYAESDGDIYSAVSLAYCGDEDKKIPFVFKSLFGFDSCVDYDKYSGRIQYVVVFEPNQIKSVNATNFNPDSDEMIDEDFDMKEITNPDDVDLSSFNINDRLNPKFWKDGKIDSRVRIALLNIADDFVDTLDVPWAEPKDVIMTGSLANYNWSKEHSDVDLHILYDFKDVDENVSLVKEYFDSKRRLWNDEHQNITIAGFQVELYVQDIHEPHASTGVYSLDKDEWLVRPNIKNFDLDYDKDAVKEKVAEYMNKIDDLCDEYDESVADCDLNELHDKAEKLFDDIKNERRNGFEHGGGEYNVGNLIFKSLRRNGYISKLSKIRTDTYDDLKSIYNENKENH